MKNVISLILLVTAVLLTGGGSGWAAPAAATRTSDIITRGPWVDVRAFANLSSAKVYAEANNKPLHITAPTTYNNLTINTEVDIIRGGSLTRNGLSTLTINGPFQAGLAQCIDSGVVLGPKSVKAVYPEWWGVTGTGDNVALQLAINSGYGRTVKLAGKPYHLSDQLTITQQVEILGAGWNRIHDRYMDDSTYPGQGTILIYNGPDNKSVISLDGSADTLDGVKLCGIAFSNAVAGSTAIYGITANSIRHSEFTNLFFERFNRCFYGVSKVFQNTFKTLAMYNFDFGFYLDSESEDNTFINCMIRGYRSGSVGVLQNSFCQKNAYIGCDFSDNNKGFRSLVSLGNTTTTLDSCAFEIGGDNAESNMSSAQIGLEIQNSTSIYSAMQLRGCRFLYAGSDATKRAAAIAINCVSGSILDVQNTTFSSLGTAISVANYANFSKLVLKNNTWPSVTTPINSEALKCPIESDSTDINYASYGRIGFRTTVAVTNGTPVTIFAPNQTTGATWLITVNDNSGAASRYGQVVLVDKGYNTSGVLVNEFTATGLSFSVSGNAVSITPAFTGNIYVHVQRLT